MTTPDVAAKLKEAQQVTQRLISEAGSARQSWVHFEAINGRDEDHRSVLRERVNRLGLGRTMTELLKLFGRDTLVALFRITDQAGDDRLTLCRLSGLLDDRQVRAECEDAARAWMPGFGSEMAESNAKRSAEAMKFIMDLVPPKWKSGVLPADPRLYNFRETLRPIRTAFLAHITDGSGVTQPLIDEIRDFLELTSELVQNAALVFTGSGLRWDADYNVRYREALEFWVHCEKGFGVD